MLLLPSSRHSGVGRNPEQSHHWIPTFVGMTKTFFVIARLVRAIQTGISVKLDYRDKPGNDTIVVCSMSYAENGGGVL